jgi:2-methylaconitate cis-trans-isomerase PrpF
MIDDNRAVSARLEAIRVAAGDRMGVRGSTAVPKVALVAPAQTFTALDGLRYESDQIDLVARVISMGNCHRAFALTVAMCLAVAARIEGTLVHDAYMGQPTFGQTGAGGTRSNIRLGHPSGVLPIDAAVTTRQGAPWAERVTVYRTARRLMEGFVRIPA